jgi:hypothetical protein
LGADLHIGRGKWLQSSKVYHLDHFVIWLFAMKNAH